MTPIVLAKRLPGKCPQVPGTSFIDHDINDKTELLLGAPFSPEKTSFLFVEKNRHKNQYLSIQITQPLNFELEYIPKSSRFPKSSSLLVGNTSETLILDSQISHKRGQMPCWKFIEREEIRW